MERTITITSDPPGALVTLNDREIGRTPVDTGFVHYGTFDVRLRLDGYEPLQTTGDATPPLWDVVPLDLVAEILPIPFESKVAWHYELEPAQDDLGALRERASALRAELMGSAGDAASGSASDDAPDDGPDATASGDASPDAASDATSG